MRLSQNFSESDFVAIGEIEKHKHVARGKFKFSRRFVSLIRVYVAVNVA